MWYQLFNSLARITQIAAQVMKTDARFSCFAQSSHQCKCRAGNWDILGWWTYDSARKTSGNCINIRSTLKIYGLFQELGQCCFDCTQWKSFFFYFRIILSCAICKVEVGMVNEFSNHVLAFVDYLLLLRSKVPNLSSYGQKLINCFYGTVASIKLSPHRLFLFIDFFPEFSNPISIGFHFYWNNN